jgi:ATP-binding cassette subfamily C exporter for protease/lipase
MTSLFHKHRSAIKALLVFGMVSNVLMLVPTIYMLQVFDRVMVSRSEFTLVAVSFITLYLFGVLALIDWSRSRLLGRLGTTLDAELSSQTFHGVYVSDLSAHLHRPQHATQHADQPQAASRRAFGDLAELRQFVAGTGLISLLDLPWALVYVGVLFLMHPMLGLLALVFAVIQALFAKYGQLRLQQPTHHSNQLAAQDTQHLQNKLKSASTLEALGMTERFKSAWLHKHARSQASHAKSQQLQHTVSSASKFIRYMQQSLTLAVGAILVIRGELSPGAMIAANILCSRALAPIDAMASSWRGLLSAREAYARLTQLLQSTHTQAPADVAYSVKGDVRIQNLSLQLPSRPRVVLQDIQYQAPAGSITLVMGPSGSGKSCLARVLLGIWQPTSGKVLLDNTAMTDWPREQIGPQVGYLPQTVDLFDDTIAANIARLGNIDPEFVVAAAKTTGLHALILRLPKGYETPVGEAGHLLSGGTRQRIGLARAVYGAPKLVVLDEPNANLDEAGEKALVQTLQTLKAQGTTVFVISHRSHLMDVADRLLVLADGLIQASGPKDGVLAAMIQPN